MIREILGRSQAAGLHLGIKKCDFAVTEVKYLRFIVQAGRAIRPEPEKIATIREWKPPTITDPNLQIIASGDIVALKIG